MPNGNHSESLQVGNMTFNRPVNLVNNNADIYGDASSPIVLNAGDTVTAWVKSTSLTGTCTLPTGHTFGSGGTFDVYGSDGTLYAYGVTATIATNALTFSSGGTAVNGGFPSSATAGMIVSKQQQVNLSLDGDNASIVGVLSTVIGHADMQDSSSATVRVRRAAGPSRSCARKVSPIWSPMVKTGLSEDIGS